jgi:hypothetical protein
MPLIAGAPYRADRPTGLTVVVAVRAGGWRHDHPPALIADQIADEIARKLVAPWLDHRDVISRTCDRRRHSATPGRAPQYNSPAKNDVQRPGPQP